MADDLNPTIDTSSIQSAQKTYAVASDHIADSLDKIRGQAKSTSQYLDSLGTVGVKALKQVERQFSIAAKTGKYHSVRLASGIKSVVLEFNHSIAAANKARDSVLVYAKAIQSSEVQLKRLQEQQEKVTYALRNARAAVAALDEQRKLNLITDKAYEKQLGELLLKETQLLGLRGQVETSILHVSSALEEHTEGMKRAEQAADEASDSIANFGNNIQTLMSKSARAEMAEASWAGGLQAFTKAAKLAAVESGRLGKFLQDMTTGGMIAYGFIQISKGIEQVGAYAKAAKVQAATLGKTANASFWDTQEAARGVTETARKFGFAVDEMNEVANRMRIGVAFDKNGLLAEAAIQKLTASAASAARTMGIDTSEAASMLEDRIKLMGMSAEDAATDLGLMQVTLQQMTAANKNNNVSNKEMVGIINDAREATGAYVTDTRILTGALRAAATQAADLGASSKMAADVAKGMGKVLSKAPDFVKIPAGMDLVSKLIGADSETFLKKFDAKTQQQLRALKTAVATGKVAQYDAGKRMMDLVGGTQEAMEVQMERTLQVFGNSPVSATLISEHFGIENMAVAGMIADQLREVREQRETLGDNLSEADKADNSAVLMLTRQAAEVNSALDGVMGEDEKLKILKDKGLSPDAAKEYLALQRKISGERKQITEELAKLEGKAGAENENKRNALRKQLYKQTTVAQAKFLKEETDPVVKGIKAIKGLAKGSELAKKLKDGLHLADLTEAKIGNEQLAQALGLHTDEAKKILNEELRSEAGLNEASLRKIAANDSETLKKQESQFDEFLVRFSEGPIDAIKATFERYLPGFSGPLGKVTAALAAWGLAYIGLSRLVGRTLKTATTAGVIAAYMSPQVRAALGAKGPGGGGGPISEGAGGGGWKRQAGIMAASIVATALVDYGVKKLTEPNEEEKASGKRAAWKENTETVANNPITQIGIGAASYAGASKIADKVGAHMAPKLVSAPAGEVAGKAAGWGLKTMSKGGGSAAASKLLSRARLANKLTPSVVAKGAGKLSKGSIFLQMLFLLPSIIQIWNSDMPIAQKQRETKKLLLSGGIGIVMFELAAMALVALGAPALVVLLAGGAIAAAASYGAETWFDKKYGAPGKSSTGTGAPAGPKLVGKQGPQHVSDRFSATDRPHAGVTNGTSSGNEQTTIRARYTSNSMDGAGGIKLEIIDGAQMVTDVKKRTDQMNPRGEK